MSCSVWRLRGRRQRRTSSCQASAACFLGFEKATLLLASAWVFDTEGGDTASGFGVRAPCGMYYMNVQAVQELLIDQSSRTALHYCRPVQNCGSQLRTASTPASPRLTWHVLHVPHAPHKLHAAVCLSLHAGFTHLQPAMTVRWSHWLMSHGASWQRDDMRLRDLLPRVATLPLGSGAQRCGAGLVCSSRALHSAEPFACGLSLTCIKPLPRRHPSPAHTPACATAPHQPYTRATFPPTLQVRWPVTLFWWTASS